MKSHKDLRKAYIDFFVQKDHSLIKPAPLVLQNDATTLFTSSGMQPLVPYLAGEQTHPGGSRLVNIQKCIRTGDIDEVGDNRHTTFFEMMGNWSLNDYFKKDQLAWIWTFFTEVLELPKERFYVTVFEGNDLVPRDDESAEIWKSLGVPEDHIYYYGVENNWWSRSGVPKAMPTGEIGGPDSEMFYDFGEGPHNGPESDESRFIEIGNSVFIQYIKNEDGSLGVLPQKNVDYGGGLERILAAWNHTPDVFMTDLFQPVIKKIEEVSGASYDDENQKAELRIISDHMRASIHIMLDGILPSNKEHGYILRRLLRRSAVKMYDLVGGMEGIEKLSEIVPSVLSVYEDRFDEDAKSTYTKIISDEMSKFSKTLEKGMKMIDRVEKIDGKIAFDLFQSYGFPFELSEELALKRNQTLSRAEFDAEKEKHQELSRSSSAGKFKGGLADHSQKVVKYHTATHLLHQALKDVFGNEIRQEGSNITQERLRFDFKLDRKPTDEEIAKVEAIVQSKIDEKLPVYNLDMPKSEAEKLGASSFFKEKYGDVVKVYFIGGSPENTSDAYSKEFCGGPHVSNTSEIHTFHISKVKKIGSQLMRLYAE